MQNVFAIGNASLSRKLRFIVVADSPDATSALLALYS
jgi:hypothetical protein